MREQTGTSDNYVPDLLAIFNQLAKLLGLNADTRVAVVAVANDTRYHVAVIRPAFSILSLSAFLYILSGKRQLHVSQDESVESRFDYCRVADDRPVTRGVRHDVDFANNVAVGDRWRYNFNFVMNFSVIWDAPPLQTQLCLTCGFPS